MVGLFEPTEHFTPRPIEPLGVLKFEGGWRLKAYSIRHASEPRDDRAFEAGVAMAANALPRPAQTERRPGVGFLILHRGRGVAYAVLAWWDNENECPLRVFVREMAGGAAWRPAAPHESVFVWDIEVMWHERQAYIGHVLAPEKKPDIEAYLADTLAVSAP